MSARYEAFGVPGIPEIRPGDDLVEILATALEAAPPGDDAAPGGVLRDGDIVIVTSKIVSKAEGRVRTGIDRDEAIDAEAVRTISEWTTPRGRTRIVETRHGFVMAAAGVDASNVELGSVVLLPMDPDGSARALRDGLAKRFGARIGVVITDTAGRVWRNGVTDFAVGSAGIRAIDDLRGSTDAYGNDLGVTVVALADELAAASELVRAKLSGVPGAVVRGLPHLLLGPDEDDPGVAALIRPSAEDRFRLGTPEAMRAAVQARRTALSFTPAPVDPGVVRQAVAAAFSAPWPIDTPPWRFVLLESDGARRRLASALDGAGLLGTAPYVVVPCLVNGSDALLGLGAAVENLLIALGTERLASAWLFPDPALSAATAALDLPVGWTPIGAVAIGHAAEPAADHPPVDVATVTVTL
ncbi:coenzyme F420-0:L-glutamate ligase [Jiangella aurantiaca]|uniref:Coenzyme F420-0:L-glutamate ligase n=1 Tax=Jiangella aurantiaca TaxID=2530373 RepID=A0A4R5AM29_9ACTN|nr:coenzyme F420-0:L-glutamate ligase [Jiangella aurantiaca]TDD73015.1 coenzyme F420-0:L-glutamate ligase [Jiangella aurantiaca]